MIRTLVFCAVILPALGNTAMARRPPGPVDKDRAFLGISLDGMSEAMCKAVGLGSGADCGVLVDDVEPKGPADKAGVKRGDVITGLGGRRMRTPADVVQEVRDRRPGDKIKIEVVRQGNTRKLSGKLGQAPADRSMSWHWSWPPGGGKHLPKHLPRDLDRLFKQLKQHKILPYNFPSAKEGQELKRRMDDLERQIRQLRKEMKKLKGKGSGSPA
jgi:membrane-associated protease RseP (regulator of RpoE activity)